MDEITPEEDTWNTLKYGYNIKDYTLETMKHYRESEGDIEIFLYIHNQTIALSITKIMVDGVEIPDDQFITIYEPTTKYQHVEMFRPFHFQVTLKW